jgi:hypothetical protein
MVDHDLHRHVFAEFVSNKRKEILPKTPPCACTRVRAATISAVTGADCETNYERHVGSHDDPIHTRKTSL